MPSTSHELIPLIQRDTSETWVDARALYHFLESGQQFADWIKLKIEDFGFIEGQDFFRKIRKSTGGRQAIDYLISMDMAKELSMLERNEKGRMARQYFIESEKKLRQLQKHLLSGVEELRELLEEVRVIEEDGVTWYPVSQISMLCGKSTPGGAMRRRIKNLEEEGKAKKMVYRKDFRPAWYVRKEHVKDVLSVNRRTIASAQFFKLLTAGGAQ